MFYLSEYSRRAKLIADEWKLFQTISSFVTAGKDIIFCVSSFVSQCAEEYRLYSHTSQNKNIDIALMWSKMFVALLIIAKLHLWSASNIISLHLLTKIVIILISERKNRFRDYFKAMHMKCYFKWSMFHRVFLRDSTLFLAPTEPKKKFRG